MKITLFKSRAKDNEYAYIRIETTTELGEDMEIEFAIGEAGIRDLARQLDIERESGNANHLKVEFKEIK